MQRSILRITLAIASLGVVGTMGCAPMAAVGNGAETTSATPQESVAQGMDHGMNHGEMNHGMDHGNMGAMSHEHMMDLGPKDEMFDLRFIDAMIPHHEGAIAMAEQVLERSQRPELRELATAIIAAQQAEIDQMKAWRAEWYPTAPETPMMYHAEMNHMMPMTDDMRNAMMMNVDLGAADEAFDLRFIEAMIPHHEGALVMAEQVLERSDRQPLQTLAQEILDSQQAEIDQMLQWKQDWYGQ